MTFVESPTQDDAVSAGGQFWHGRPLLFFHDAQIKTTDHFFFSFLSFFLSHQGINLQIGIRGMQRIVFGDDCYLRLMLWKIVSTTECPLEWSLPLRPRQDDDGLVGE
jgi:hypothetical protein